MDKQQCVIIRGAGNTCLDITDGVAVNHQELGNCRCPFEDTIPVFAWKNRGNPHVATVSILKQVDI
jgi:hypothetical protein